MHGVVSAAASGMSMKKESFFKKKRIFYKECKKRREIWPTTERQRAEGRSKAGANRQTVVSVVEPKAGWLVELVDGVGGGNAGGEIQWTVGFALVQRLAVNSMAIPRVFRGDGVRCDEIKRDEAKWSLLVILDRCGRATCSIYILKESLGLISASMREIRRMTETRRSSGVASAIYPLPAETNSSSRQLGGSHKTAIAQPPLSHRFQSRSGPIVQPINVSFGDCPGRWQL